MCEEVKPFAVSVIAGDNSHIIMNVSKPATSQLSHATNTQFGNSSILERLLSTEVPGGPPPPNVCIQLPRSYFYSGTTDSITMPSNSCPVTRLPSLAFPLTTMQDQTSLPLGLGVTNSPAHSTDQSFDTDTSSSAMTPLPLEMSRLSEPHLQLQQNSSSASSGSSLNSSHSQSIPSLPTLTDASSSLSPHERPLTNPDVGVRSTASTASIGGGKSKRSRGPRHTVPDTQKDDKYHERRKRNNLAARRCA